ncbi:hypothetical protein BX600DRAFT_493560 [Xylariales sp. PMI_506]|nr:hypothetical protein BX600DRAFT_493560 [Xylariales sp. PMI_506]
MALRFFLSGILGRWGASAQQITARMPVPADSTQPSLLTLPKDIILQIFEFVQEASPRSITELASVSSYFYQIARYVRHRHVSINLDQARSFDRLKFISKNALLPTIRTFQVLGTLEDDSPILPLLANTILAMTGLRDMEWKAETIPESVLKSLQRCPQVRLHISFYSETYNSSKAQTLIESLMHSQNLSSIRAHIEYTSANKCIEVLRPMKLLLLSCPNLRKLMLDVTQPRTGCVVFGPEPEYCGLGLTRGERPPPLEELEIISYPWGHNLGNNKTPLSTNYVGYPEEGDEIDYWASNFDWSQLRALSESSGVLSTKIVSQLTSLKEVDFMGSRHTDEEITRFIEDVPSSLESISITRLNPTATIPRHHRETLRQLHIHQTELWNGKWKDDTLSHEALVTLRDTLPNLKELGIDVARVDGEWPWDTFDALASFKQLRSLTICFDIGIVNIHEPLKPYITTKSASDIFQYILQRSPTQPSPLQRLTVCSGAPPPLGHGIQAEEAYWPMENATKLVCELTERDTEAVQGKIKVTCPLLSNEHNDELERLSRGEEQLAHHEASVLALRVAMEGPINVTKWKEIKHSERARIWKEAMRARKSFISRMLGL